MRLFTGLELPAEVVRKLEELTAKLRVRDSRANISWSKPQNLHITTKFIGEWPEERLSELRRVLDEMPTRQPIAVRVRGLGFYPNERAPRVYWCGVEAPGLEQLASDTDRAAAGLGIASENRPYNPHLTLARIKGGRWTGADAGSAGLEFGAFEARSFFLYRSILQAGGSVYTKLAEFRLLKT